MYSQDGEVNLILGTWRSPVIDDCPDFIEFNNENKYYVYNECNSDFDSGIIEKGEWYYNKLKKQIKLCNRNFVSSNSLFSASYGKNDEIYFNLKLVSNKFLIISVEINGKIETQKYTKISYKDPK